MVNYVNVNNYLLHFKSLITLKRSLVVLLTTTLFLFLNVNLRTRSVIISPTKLCFSPDWRDDLSTTEINCFQNCCSSGFINLTTDFHCIISCKPALISFYQSNNQFFTFLPIQIIPGKSKKIISFSLYGSSDRYLKNALLAIRGYKKLLPDWIPRFYVASNVHSQLINRLVNEECEVIVVHQNQADYQWNQKDSNYHGMFWRFFVAEDLNVERYIVRDADSLPIQREIEAINQWINEKTLFHVMRDHIEHNTEILGGMWGGVVDVHRFNVSKLYEKASMDGFDKRDGYSIDQFFLKLYVWPIAKLNMTCHSSYHWSYIDSKGCKDFPTKRIDHEFVGAINPT